MEITIDQIFAKEILSGLKNNPKFLPSKYFYDQRGDDLFQQIMKLDEYYPTRAEYEILADYHADMLDLFSQENEPFQLIEMGAGDGTKTKLLLRYFLDKKVDFKYRPVDISANVLRILEKHLEYDLPGLDIDSMAKEYYDALNELKNQCCEKKVVLFLGGNIGNFKPEQVHYFLQKMSESLNAGDAFMLGIDIKKDPLTVLGAYNDAKGVTRAFNLNLLERINRELDADFDLQEFYHYPLYDPHTGDAKSYLVSRKEQDVHLNVLDETIHFDEGETIWTELSRKYSIPEIEQMADEHGFKVARHFFDRNHYFTDTLWIKK